MHLKGSVVDYKRKMTNWYIAQSKHLREKVLSQGKRPKGTILRIVLSVKETVTKKKKEKKCIVITKQRKRVYPISLTQNKKGQSYQRTIYHVPAKMINSDSLTGILTN